MYVVHEIYIHLCADISHRLYIGRLKRFGIYHFQGRWTHYVFVYLSQYSINFFSTLFCLLCGARAHCRCLICPLARSRSLSNIVLLIMKLVGAGTQAHICRRRRCTQFNEHSTILSKTEWRTRNTFRLYSLINSYLASALCWWYYDVTLLCSRLLRHRSARCRNSWRSIVSFVWVPHRIDRVCVRKSRIQNQE